MSIAKRIKIITQPHGTAPAWVRAAWVGLEFPCATLECGHIPEYVQDVGQPKHKGPLTVPEFLALPPTTKIAGYNVLQSIAIGILEQHDQKAAAWWRNHGYPAPDPHSGFRFKREEVEVVDTYTAEELQKLGPMKVYDDMETGSMRPVS